MAPRFGESFNPDQGSRVNVLDQEAKVPEYVEFGRNIRSLLKGQDQETGEIKTNWPECPKNLHNLEDLLIASQDAVTSEWEKVVAPLLQEKAQEWIASIPDDEEHQDLIKLLANPQEFDNNIKTQQLGVLEGLKQFSPEAWRSLVLVSSERQLACLSLLRHWLKNDLSEDDLQKIGMTKVELEILLDAGGILGKYIDHAYVKQIELADEPGGTSATKLGQKKGAEFIYDIYRSADGNEVDHKAFSTVFAGEWPKIVDGLKMLSHKVEALITEYKLPESYKKLPPYLDHLISIYASQETSPKKIFDLWNELDLKMNELAANGCPLMIIPGFCVGVTSDANKVDVELRLGFRTPEIKELEGLMDNFREIAQNILDGHQDKLAKAYKIPRMVLNVQPFGFGSSLQLFTLAETGNNRMVSHVNLNNQMALKGHWPIIEKAFSMDDLNMTQEEYKEAINLETALHEIGHNVMPTEDEAVLKRVGGGADGTVLEELKAEGVGMLIFMKSLEDKTPEEAEEAIKKEFFVKLITACDYLANNSSDKGSDGERYYYSGLAMIDRLLVSGAITMENGRYHIIDASKGVESIARLGQEILDRFYLSENSGKKEVKDYIGSLRKKKNAPEIQAFKTGLK
ncbi:MAG: hypothetical protein WCV73_03780 [Patescibacteria group bacterium]